jgi:4-hydroxybenzoate polyprenyltransferase
MILAIGGAMLIQLLKTMRPRQWTKNFMVFIPFAFTLREYWRPFSPGMWTMLGRAVAGFILFCIISGVIYLINDLVDIEKDRLHPK